MSPSAGVAQSVEHLICNQGVGGSNPFASSRKQISGGRRIRKRRNGFSKRTPFVVFPACGGLFMVALAGSRRAQFLVSLFCETLIVIACEALFTRTRAAHSLGQFFGCEKPERRNQGLG
jgi:hypothetical protein